MSYYREYNIFNRDSGESKVFKFNCLSTFYEFKKMISDKYNIPLYKLLIHNAKGEEVRLESYFKSMN